MKYHVEKILSIFLYLVLVHSLIVGLLLMFLPIKAIVFFGFPDYPVNFFRAQGGIFHIVLCIAYFFAAKKPINNYLMVKFSYIAKFIAFIFLSLYYFIEDHILLVLLSGIADLGMGIIIFVLSKNISVKHNK